MGKAKSLYHLLYDYIYSSTLTITHQNFCLIVQFTKQDLGSHHGHNIRIIIQKKYAVPAKYKVNKTVVYILIYNTIFYLFSVFFWVMYPDYI